MLAKAVAAESRDVRITGIDLAQSFVYYARMTIQDPRVTFEQGDACDLPFADGAFDQTLSLLVIMFIEQPDRVVREMHRVTRPGGTVSTCTWDRDGLEMSSIFWQEAELLDPSAQSRAEGPRHSNSRGQLAKLWRDAGLRDVLEVPIESA